MIVEVQPAPAGVGVFVRGMPEDAQASMRKRSLKGLTKSSKMNKYLQLVDSAVSGW